MDIAIPQNEHAKTIRRIVIAAIVLLLVATVAYALSRLRPAAPSVEGASLFSDTVKRGDMLRAVHGVGTLVPEDIQWIPALNTARVSKIVLHPGATVKTDSIILELTNPELERDTLDAEYQLKAAEAQCQSVRAQMGSDILNQRAAAAAVRSEYEQAKIQHAVDEKLVTEHIGAEVTAQLSKVKEDQLGIRAQIEEARAKNAEDTAEAKIAAEKSHVDQQRALYNLRRSQLDALHVRAGINGVLQLVPVEVGQSVAPGTNLARVADPKKLKAEIKISETQANELSLGMKSTIDTRNGIANGRVSRIDPSVQNGTVTVDISFDDPLPNGARPDLSVDGTIEIENMKNILFVGRPAFGQPESTVGLFKLTGDGSEATRTSVKLGRFSVSSVEVRQGLREGDRVILSDTSAWSNYDRIRLK
ncbi:MAG TPA: HlyD family efflux transporter periplasmic adaptor subunit [Candidatus Sulfotelmatobacter sp.]|jgi:HlyD family secretion protein|nr:HlyD family efflux transporter periplasmic adaptor subunit [Candidatus Sulfotelmatobacter sp.]